VLTGRLSPACELARLSVQLLGGRDREVPVLEGGRFRVRLTLPAGLSRVRLRLPEGGAGEGTLRATGIRVTLDGASDGGAPALVH